MNKKIIPFLIIGVLLAAALGAFVFYFYPRMIKPVRIYNEAVELYDSGEYVLSALRFEMLGGHEGEAKDAWLKAGDASFQRGELAQARTYYLKGGADSKVLEKIDSAYYENGVTAYADNDRITAENCFSCISYGSPYLNLLDTVRIPCAERLLEEGDQESALKIFRLCSESSRGAIAEVWLGAGKKRLDADDADEASALFAKALSYSSDRKTMLSRIDGLWRAASDRARLAGNEELAELYYSRISTGPDEMQALEEAYAAANAAFEDGRWFEALARFEELGDYLDSSEKVELLTRRLRLYYEAGGAGFYALHLPDSTVQLVGSWGEFTSPDWTDIVDLSVGRIRFAVGLKSDGTVVFLGTPSYGNSEVESWNDIVAVSCGNRHTVGLKSDGTVVACGDDEYGQVSGVNEWSGITNVFAGRGNTIGITRSGSLIYCGKNDVGQLDLDGVTGVVSVACGYEHTVCLRSDGTVYACGSNEYGQTEVSGWTDVVAVWAGAYHTVALKSDGTLLACGLNADGECEVGGYENVLCAGCGDGFTVILLKDGTEIKLGKLD